MRRVDTLVLVTLVMLVTIPANAYGDPSGGALFQVLMPTLAAIWAMWMIFANRVRRSLGNLLHKLRGSAATEHTILQSGSLATEKEPNELSSPLL